jgi:hypothetical protein
MRLRPDQKIFFFVLPLALLNSQKAFSDSADGSDTTAYPCHQFTTKSGSLEEFLQSRPLLALKQHWLKTPAAEFEPGFVSAAWDKDHLYIRAALSDRDIFNPLVGFNLPFYQKGDIFEILVRSRDSEAYFEFQITPQNQVLQLMFPRGSSLSDFKDSGADMDRLIETFKVSQRIVETQTEVNQAKNIWTVLVKIPAQALASDSQLRSNDSLRVSFCRYDYTRGKADAVLSSTSDHSVRGFHRQEEWTTITLLAN